MIAALLGGERVEVDVVAEFVCENVGCDFVWVEVHGLGVVVVAGVCVGVVASCGGEDDGGCDDG